MRVHKLIVILTLHLLLLDCTQIQKSTGNDPNPKKKKEKREKETLALLLLLQPSPVIIGEEKKEFKSSMKILIPAYFYDSYFWNQLLKKVNENFVVILNPSNGPGTSSDWLYPQYQYWNRKLVEKNAIVIGYVPTDYGRRNIDSVKNDIQQWRILFRGIQGFFIDEASSNKDSLSYYQEIYNYVKGINSNLKVVLNHGVFPESEFYDIADINVVYEEDPNKLTSFSPRDNELKYSKEHFAMIIHSADKKDLEKMLLYVEEKHIGFIYITDKTMPNPFDELPSFWDDFTSKFFIVN
ncbi:MAG: spherulation-specific family 4 protein [Leptospiraceae bacterium]|nr:spherulation-specific family 4 protein [Leptospiraceae bacterium]MDW7976217.1 spherulation-specific family 4 protein [Leptospiraceae bacterium]